RVRRPVFSSRSFHVLERALVLETDLVNQLGLHNQALLDCDGERLGIGLRIVDRQLHLDVKSGRRISSRILAPSVTTLPCQSIQLSSRRPIESTTSVSPDHFADEYPIHDGVGSIGSGRPSVNTCRYPAFHSLSTIRRPGVWTNFSRCGMP